MVAFEKIEIPRNFDSSKISNFLTESEKNAIKDLADYVSTNAVEFLNDFFMDDTNNNDGDMYGLQCATSAHRNYIFALMTANAVKKFRNQFDYSPTVAELGLGSGLNAFAAFIADKNARVVGYETDINTIYFAKKLKPEFDIMGNLEIRNQSFLDPGMENPRLDIIVNENLSPSLAGEPLFEAANAIFPFTHENTIWVPNSLDIFAEGPFNLNSGRIAYLGLLELSKSNNYPISLSKDFQPGEIDTRYPMVKLKYNIKDFEGNPIVTSDVPFLETKSKVIRFDALELDPYAELRFTMKLDIGRKDVTKSPLGLSFEASYR
jgi:predicted RNA methylase